MKHCPTNYESYLPNLQASVLAPISFPEPVHETLAMILEEEEDKEKETGLMENAWVKCKHGFVYASVGTLTTLGNGYEWAGNTADWAWNGSTDFVCNNMKCGCACSSTPE